METNDEIVTYAPADPAVVQVTLDEFCARFSSGDKRFELIAGFYHDETRAGRVKDHESNFASRFTAYANRPVN